MLYSSIFSLYRRRFRLLLHLLTLLRTLCILGHELQHLRRANVEFKHMLSLLEANIVGELDPSDEDPSASSSSGSNDGGGGGLEGLVLLAAEVHALIRR